ncbi:MAG: hypothetical protein LBQ66_02050, partial [Planctomycetaceae bacterium]|nr:hypothetical protein [Planctomycetaceae bacterium]
YYTQRRAGRPRSSPSPTFGGVCEYQNFFRSFGDEGKPRPYNINVFWFLAIEIPVRFGDPVVGLRRRYSPRKPGSRLPTLRSPTHKTPHLVGGKPTSLTLRECVYDLCVTTRR